MQEREPAGKKKNAAKYEVSFAVFWRIKLSLYEVYAVSRNAVSPYPLTYGQVSEPPPQSVFNRNTPWIFSAPRPRPHELDWI